MFFLRVYLVATFLMILLPGTLVAEGQVLVVLERMAGGLESPRDMVQYPHFPGRFLVAEKGGRIRIVQNGKILPNSFLDLRSKIGDQPGLSRLVLHPKFVQTGKAYLLYATSSSRVVSEFTIAKSTGVLEPQSERVLLRVNQEFENPQLGGMAFGSNSNLFIAFGDGGGKMDPKGHGQNPHSLHGALLRVDVDEGDPYLPPIDNPFAVDKSGAAEVWAYGFHDPAGLTYDDETGNVWLLDRGVANFDEINIVEKGKNYGWKLFEGTLCFKTRFECIGKYQEPLHVASRKAKPLELIGGLVYRGEEIPDLEGAYLYADRVGGEIKALWTKAGVLEREVSLAKTQLQISAITVDAEGEVFLVDERKGEIYRLLKGESSFQSQNSFSLNEKK